MLSDAQLANAIRALSMDAVEQANSGHPGAPMGMADIAQVLWRGYLQHNPTNPQWFNRDRFVLSNGHGSMLLYALLHLSGYDLDLQSLKDFRQLHSKTPGHPEYGYTPGVETTTGPLGQGLANAIGMALAEKVLAAQFNRPEFEIVDHFTYVFLGDGCLMEGVSHEACALAGSLGLGKVIAFWDDNRISIDGQVDNWFTDDTPKRFQAYQWHVIPDVDGHCPDAIRRAIEAAQANTQQPTLICTRTVIGFGAPNKQGTASCHGAPLGETEINAARQQLDWPYPPFEIPAAIYQAWDAREAGQQAEDKWQKLLTAYQQAYPELAATFARRIKGELPTSWDEQMQAWIQEANTNLKNIASRQASQLVLDQIGQLLPELIGGSADLTPSNLTFHQSGKVIDRQTADGNYVHYGVREFGMTSIMTGIALHGGFIPYGGTFLVFMEYARNAVRMAALMKQRVIYVYTHDSIGLGEDGPTHQPVEQLANLRMTPNMHTWRPCDQLETWVAWRCAIEHTNGPTALILSRQKLQQHYRSPQQCEAVARGGYILRDCVQGSDIIFIATGSEVMLAMKAAQQLLGEGVKVRVVSMPSPETFLQQDMSYQQYVLPPKIKRRLVIEAGIADYWYRFIGFHGDIVGMHTFGESAPAKDLFVHFGFTLKNVVMRAQQLLQNR